MANWFTECLEASCVVRGESAKIEKIVLIPSYMPKGLCMLCGVAEILVARKLGEWWDGKMPMYNSEDDA